MLSLVTLEEMRTVKQFSTAQILGFFLLSSTLDATVHGEQVPLYSPPWCHLAWVPGMVEKVCNVL